VKSLTRTERTVTIIFWMMLIQTLFGLVPGIAIWRWPSSSTWLWLFIIALSGTYGHYCLANAVRYADASAVVPLDFLRVPLTAAAGWLLYSEGIDLLAVVGTLLILAANVLNLRGSSPPGRQSTP